MTRRVLSIVIGCIAAGMLLGASEAAQESSSAVPRVTFVVAPDGDDTNPGTLEKPFATFERARDEVNEAKASAPPGQPIVVEFRGGQYFLPLPVTLVKRDSGTKDRPVIYRAHADEKPIFYGGVLVTNFTPIAEMPGAFVADLTAMGLQGVPLSELFRLLPDGGVERLTKAEQFEGSALKPSRGTWSYDTATGRLFIRPPEAVLIEAFPVIVSKGRCMLALLRGTEYVTIAGLSFRGCEGTAVVLSQTLHCTIDRCAIEQVGDEYGTGIVIDMGEANVISGCVVSFTGRHGIVVDGGHHVHQRECRPARNRVVDTVVHHPGEATKEGAGISTTGMGNEITGNRVHDCPRMGIMVGGNHHTIERNVVQRTNYVAHDSAAIYVAGRDFLAGRGTVIQYNLVEDVGGWHRADEPEAADDGSNCGILLDAHASGVDVVGNVIVRAPAAGIRIENGRSNRITDNVLSNSEQIPVVQTLPWPSDDHRWERDIKAVGWTFDQAVNHAHWTNWRSLRAMDMSPEECLAKHGTTCIHNTIERNEALIGLPDPAAIEALRIPASAGGSP